MPKSFITRRFSSFLLAGTLLAPFGARAAEVNSSPAPLKVVTSGAFTAAVVQLAPEYERTAHVRLDVGFGPSLGTTKNAIPVRLERGESIDLVIMAAPGLGALGKQGKARP